MLKVFKTMAELPFGKMMEIYAQSNQEHGEQWLQESKERQIELAEQEVYAYLRQCFFTRPGSRCFLWEEEGRAICALRCESYGDGLLLTALETHPDYRGRGIATKLLTAVLETLEPGNVYAHIRKDNLSSLKVHSRCGFLKVKSGARMLDGSYSGTHDTYRKVIEKSR